MIHPLDNWDLRAQAPSLVLGMGCSVHIWGCRQVEVLGAACLAEDAGSMMAPGPNLLVSTALTLCAGHEGPRVAAGRPQGPEVGTLASSTC